MKKKRTRIKEKTEYGKNVRQTIGKKDKGKESIEGKDRRVNEGNQKRKGKIKPNRKTSKNQKVNKLGDGPKDKQKRGEKNRTRSSFSAADGVSDGARLRYSRAAQRGRREDQGRPVSLIERNTHKRTRTSALPRKASLSLPWRVLSPSRRHVLLLGKNAS